MGMDKNEALKQWLQVAYTSGQAEVRWQFMSSKALTYANCAYTVKETDDSRPHTDKDWK